MIDRQSELTRQINQKKVHKRQFTKRDGRDLFLYGFEAHTETALEQDGGEVAKGGELRYHPLRQEWNVYAPHRQNRTFKPSSANDPLAPSKLGGAPTEIPFTQFEIAIFENKFTSLHKDAPTPMSITGLKSKLAKGRCDVVVYTAADSGSLATIGQARRRLLIETWVDRYEALFDQGCDFVLPFENRGEEVGVTLPHPHGQIYAFPFIPDVQAKAAKAFRNGYDLSADIKRNAEVYGVANAGGMQAFCPPYTRFPYETWIAPIEKIAGPWDFNETQSDGFGHLLGEMTRKYDEFFQRPTAYMLSLHAAPKGEDNTFHFTAQFYPLLRAPNRVKYLASVEQSTGAFTVDVMPETAAKTLRTL